MREWGCRAGAGQVCGFRGKIGPSHQHPIATLRLIPYPVLPLARAGWTLRRGPRSSRMPTGHPYQVHLCPNYPPDPTAHPTESAKVNGRRPPPSPPASEPGVGSLAPVCGAVRQGQKSRRISRALLWLRPVFLAILLEIKVFPKKKMLEYSLFCKTSHVFINTTKK